MAWIVEHALPAVVALLVIGGILQLYAWTELEEFNWLDILTRRGPPFEDLSARGQALTIVSWLCTAAAVAVIVIRWVLPRIPR